MLTQAKIFLKNQMTGEKKRIQLTEQQTLSHFFFPFLVKGS